MDPEEVALRTEEYYDTLADSESLHDILNQNAGLVLARVGSYPPWPARYSEPGEYAKMSKYRLKKSHACVYFFGTRNFGWVPKSAIMPFSQDVGVLKSAKKYNAQLMQEALEEAKFILDGTDGAGIRFYDRIMERKDDAVDLPCEICNRVDDHYSNLILCDGVDCKREFHMNCLVPPLVAVPPGDWFCPECTKDMSSKQLKASRRSEKSGQMSADEDDLSTTADAAVLSPGSSATPPTRKVKKEKQKLRDGSLKRRLQAEVEQPDAAGAGVGVSGLRQSSKRSRFPRSIGESSAESSPSKSIPEASPQRDMPQTKPPTTTHLSSGSSASSKKPPVIDIPLTSVQLGMNVGDVDDDDSEVESDERCLMCGYGGELILCEFPGCTKVYHQFCLGAYSFPKDEDVAWFCPRHTCALTGEKECLLDLDGGGSCGRGRGASPRKPVAKNLLWKCTQCPLGISHENFPPLPTTSLFSKKLKTFICPNCSHNAPAKVQLGRMLEKLWSTMATNRQGMPFCGPLLSGLDDDDDDDDVNALRELDLFKILAKIRRLEYEHSSTFIDDVDQLVENALAIIGDRSQPLVEAAKTVKLICNEQVSIHQHKILAIDNKVKRSKLESRKQKEQKDSGPWSWKRKWPVRWRQECGVSDDKNYPQLEARSLDEWTAYITSAPLYATGDALDDRFDETEVYAPRAAKKSEEPERLASNSNSNNNSNNNNSNSASASRSKAAVTQEAESVYRVERTHTEPPTFPGLTLSEGTDIMMALGQLSKNDHESRKVQFGGAKEGDFDDVDGCDFFLSPSSSEMQHMFDQQSSLLRQTLEAHSALQRSWLLSQHRLLGLGENNGFSIGEGRLAAELRLANKNLRARLRNKDKLVDQLTADHTTLRSEMAALQKELSENKLRVQELERKCNAEENNAVASGEETSKSRAANADPSAADAGGGVSSGEEVTIQKNSAGRFPRSNPRKAAK